MSLRKFGDPKLLKQLMPDVSHKRQYLKFWFLFAGITLCIFMISGPQFGTKLETVKKKGIEVMVCLDVSNSMLSEDVSPSRLEKSKQMLSKMIEGFSNDKVGMVVFAGEAYIQLPITTDYLAAKMYLSSINTEIVPIQGTAIGAAITLAAGSFTSNEASEKTIIVITDGENHEDNAIAAAKVAAEKGIKTNVVGVGTTEGAPIPIHPKSNNFRKDTSGNFVVTSLNEEMCRQIAAAGNGVYARSDNTNNALRSLQAELSKMSKTDLESKVYSEYNERFQTLAWLALFILIFDFFILDRKNRLYRKVKLFS